MKIFVPSMNCSHFPRELQRWQSRRQERQEKSISEPVIEMEDISLQKTGASTATISRVNRSLNYGNDGYDMVFERMEK